MLCPGCPHRGVFYVLNKLGMRVMGDIGCYTLAALPPLSAMDACLCMGASIGMAGGAERAQGKAFSRGTVAVLGDSTFIHSGITSLIDAVYNRETITVVILDNRITGMTGHQQNPATGFDIHNQPAPQLNLEKLVESCGVSDVRVVDPFDLKATEQAIREAAAQRAGERGHRAPSLCAAGQDGAARLCDRRVPWVRCMHEIELPGHRAAWQARGNQSRTVQRLRHVRAGMPL